MAVNPHENIGHANDKVPLSPFESAPKTPESMSFTAIMGHELSTAPAKLLNQESVFKAQSGKEHLDLGNWKPEDETKVAKTPEIQAPPKQQELAFDSAQKLDTNPPKSQQDIFAQADAKVLQFV